MQARNTIHAPNALQASFMKYNLYKLSTGKRLTIATHSEASLATHTPYCNPAIQTPYRQAPQCSYAQSSFASYRHTHRTAASLTKYPAIQTPYREAPQCSYAQSSFASYRHIHRTAASLTKYPAIQSPYRQAPQCSYVQSSFASYRHMHTPNCSKLD